MLARLVRVALSIAVAAASCADVRRDERETASLEDLVGARCGACGADRAGCLATFDALRRKRWRPEHLDAALRRGGFACRWAAVAAWRYGPRSVRDVGAYAVDAALHASFDAACGLAAGAWASTLPGDVSPKRVVAVRHNGLGNQLFQYAFASLLAASLGAEFSDGVVGPAELVKEGGVPPHTALGDAALDALFPKRRAARAPGACGPRDEPTWNATRDAPGAFGGGGPVAVVSERRWDLRARPLRDTLGRALARDVACVRTIGYFHDDALFRGSRDALRADLNATPPVHGPAPSDIVVHVRLCDAPHHHYAYYDLSYYAPILDELLAREPGAIRVVSACDAARPGVVRDLLGAYAAATKVEAPPGDAAAGLVADFRYLAAAERLVVAQSTLSFWAAFLSRAREIHAPLQAAVPTMYWAPEVVLHDATRGRFFGKVTAAGLAFARSAGAPAKVPASGRRREPPRNVRGAARKRREERRAKGAGA